jgi:alkyl hydroperoxide reductase subunit AhpF
VIPLKEQEILKQRFARDLQSRVRVDFFGQKSHGVFVPGRAERSAVSEDVRKLLHELAGLNLRISLTTHDIDDDAPAAQSMGVEGVPAIVLRGQTNRAIRFFGNPRMRLFTAFVEALVLVAHGKGNLETETLKTLRKLKTDVSLKVFVTPPCAHSPTAVISAMRMALENSHVKLDIYDVTTFPEMIGPFYVAATPMQVFNDQYAIPGVIDDARLADDLLLAAQGQEPSKGGDAKRLTPLARPQPRKRQPQGPHTTPGGLYVPR